MKGDVAKFCQTCALCQKLSYHRPVVVAKPISIGGDLRPMRRLCVDALDVVETEDGYKYILAIMDSFTRCIELYALRSLDATEAAAHLIAFLGRYGTPSEILSDRGPQFVNELIAAVLKAVGIRHVMSLAYSKEENGRIERANREILRHLRAFIGHSKVVDDWVLKIPFVQRIMNASVLQASADLQGDATQKHLHSVPSEKLTLFEVGDWVLVLPHNYSLTGRRREGDKLSSFWLGPFRVLSSTGNNYNLYDSTQDREIQRHVTDLKRFRFDPRITDPVKVAQIDRREFVIESINDHRGDTKKKSTLEFLVEDYNLWLPWKELMNTVQLRTYLAQKNLLKLLPKDRR